MANESNEVQYADAAKLIFASENIVCFTGAGVSTPSGIPDFRSAQSGLWNQVDSMRVASITGFRLDPTQFYNWFKPLGETIRKAVPNAAHFAFADLKGDGTKVPIITQNIDGLHQLAGSDPVIEIHGSLNHLLCLRCNTIHETRAFIDAYLDEDRLPLCTQCNEVLKPETILFGEDLPKDAWNRAIAECMRCDLLIVSGSSLDVSPANLIPRIALNRGATLIIINHTETDMDSYAAFVFRDDVASTLPLLRQEVMRLGRK